MPVALKEHLLQRTAACFQETLRLLESVTPEAATADRRADWPHHKNHVGQDGSIAGVVHHLAAWKEAFTEYLRGNVVDFRAVGPKNPTWPELQHWLKRTGEEWLLEAAKISDAALEIPLPLSGLEEAGWYTPLNMIQEIHDHEVEHLGQINYLLQAQTRKSG